MTTRLVVAMGRGLEPWLEGVRTRGGATTGALAQDKPHKGGMLRVALAGDPPSLDMHQEQTFLVDIPLSTVYNTLVVFDPHGYPNIIGDLAKPDSYAYGSGFSVVVA